MLLALVSLTFAQDAEVFVGGGLQGRGALDLSDAGGFAGNVEAEVSVAGNAGGFIYRADLDATMDYAPTFGFQDPPPDFGVNEIVRPEWLMLGYNGGSWEARGGVVNPGYGLEDWDDWTLYLPTHGQFFDPSPGRLAGSEFAWYFENGMQLAVGGGYDLDWESPNVETNVVYEGDAWSTWSGVSYYPSENYVTGIFSGEWYVADPFWLAWDSGAGAYDGGPFATAAIIGVFLPEAMVNPTVRVEGAFDQADFGLAPFTASVGAAVVPVDFLKVLVEGKLTGVDGGDPVPSVAFSVNVYRPEPEEEEE